MLPVVCLAIATCASTADVVAQFDSQVGTHRVVVVDGDVTHALDDGRYGSVNDETARWPRGGNRLGGVVAVAGSGFAGLDDVMVLAVDKDGGVWATVRLPNGVWLPWGSVTAEAKLTGPAVGVSCSVAGRTLTVVVSDSEGGKTTCVRQPNGVWTK